MRFCIDSSYHGSVKMRDLVKRFFLGFVAGIVGFIPYNLCTNGAVKFCYGQNADLPFSSSLLNTPSRDVKIQCFRLGMVEAPIKEEILFRGIIQGLFLHRIPNAVLQRFCPNKSWIFNAPFACGMRVIAVSSLFASMHGKREISPQARTKKVYTFFLGLGLGVIKESRLKLIGAIGAHMANNCISLKPLLINAL